MRRTVGEIIGARARARAHALLPFVGRSGFKDPRDKGIKNDKTRRTCVLRAKRYLQ